MMAGTVLTEFFAKEFKLGKDRQNILSVNARYLLIGGMRNLPIDRESSVANGYQVNIWDQGYAEKSSDYFRIDLQIRFIKKPAKIYQRMEYGDHEPDQPEESFI